MEPTEGTESAADAPSRPRQVREIDVIVIGAGAVGENVADRVVQGGSSALLIESALVGGECSYWACMPSKALLRSSAALEAARRVDGARQAITGEVDAAAVLARRTSFTSNWDDSGQVSWVDGAGIQLQRGTAKIVGERRVEVTTPEGEVVLWTANHAVVLATGSAPVIPPVPGLADTPFWGTKDATSARDIPRSLAVLGGGVAGTELGQAFSRLGSEVTIVARGEVLAAFAAPARKLVVHALREEGVDVREHTETASVRMERDGFVITLGDGSEITADRLLVSTGRRPFLDVGLESIGLAPVKGKLDVGSDGRVAGVDGGWLYAAGDAAGKVLLTHQGKYEARAVGDVIAARAAGRGPEELTPWSQYTTTADEFAVPRVVFSDPEIAAVGMTEAQAREAYENVKVVAIPLAVAGSSLQADGYKGWAEMIVDEDREVIVGLTFAGQDVAEMLHAATIAIVGEVPLRRLWHAVPSYPTMSEIWLRLLESYGL